MFDRLCMSREMQSWQQRCRGTGGGSKWPNLIKNGIACQSLHSPRRATLPLGRPVCTMLTVSWSTNTTGRLCNLLYTDVNISGTWTSLLWQVSSHSLASNSLSACTSQCAQGSSGQECRQCSVMVWLHTRIIAFICRVSVALKACTSA